MLVRLSTLYHLKSCLLYLKKALERGDVLEADHWITMCEEYVDADSNIRRGFERLKFLFSALLEAVEEGRVDEGREVVKKLSSVIADIEVERDHAFQRTVDEVANLLRSLKRGPTSNQASRS